MTNLDVVQLEKCINSLGEKFIRHPYNFFTESDAHSFLFYYIFRYATREFKVQYNSRDSYKTVLVHREYPTAFRYRKDGMKLDNKGGRGHFDLVILDPSFLATHEINQVIAKKYSKTQVDVQHHLFAAVEFKFITNALGARMKDEIRKDVENLAWALELQEGQCEAQCRHAYALIFNRHGPEVDYWKSQLPELSRQNPRVQILYIESVAGNQRHYQVKYYQPWSDRLRFGSSE